MKHKVIALLLAATMVAGALSACGQKEETEETIEKSSETSKVEESKSQEESKEEVKELTTVKIMCIANGVRPEEKTEDWPNYPVSQALIEDLAELGIQLEMEYIPNGELVNVAQTRLAAGVDVPDVISFPFYDLDQQCVEWGEAGVISDVAELVEQYDEDGSIRAFYDKYGPGVWEKLCTVDGKRYWFSYFTAAGRKNYDIDTGEEYTHAGTYTLQVRQDWLDKIGVEYKMVWTPQELFDLLQKMRDEDANGNGKADEVIQLSIGDFRNHIAQAFGLHHNLLYGATTDVNGNDISGFYCNFYHENFPAYIEYMNSLFEAGLYTVDALSGENLIATDRAGAAWHSGGTDLEAQMVNPDTTAKYYVPIIVTEDGNVEDGWTVMASNQKSSTYSHFIVPAASENKEAVVRLFDYIYTEKYALRCEYGLEGVAWEYDDATGLPKRILSVDTPEGRTLQEASLAQNCLPRLVLWGTFKDMYEDSWPEYKKYKYEKWYDNLRALKTAEMSCDPQFAMGTPEELEIVSKTENVLTTYVNEMLTDLILGEKSIDDYPKYLKEMEELGLKEYLAVMEARFDRANK